jgi:hypothetical protein
MLAALIVLTGVSGFATLQASLQNAFLTSDYRQIAHQLAAEKIADLRQFVTLRGLEGGSSYQQIADNSGGTIPAGPRQIWIRHTPKIKHTFNLTWQITEQYYVDSDNDGISDKWVTTKHKLAPQPIPQIPQRKLLTVLVAWSDPNAKPKITSLDGVISPVPLSRSALLGTSLDDVKPRPDASYSWQSGISHELENKQYSRDFISLPPVFSNQDQSIDSTAIQTHLIDKTVEIKAEFKTIPCTCIIRGDGQGKTPSAVIMTDDKLSIAAGKWKHKTTGNAQGSQHQLCDLCCRDHHDNPAMLRENNYYREHQGAPHAHFTRADADTFKLATQIGDRYDEVCRFRRLDGDFTLTNDWQGIHTLVLPDHLEPQHISTYRRYIKEVLKAHILDQAKPDSPFEKIIKMAKSVVQLQDRTIYLEPISTFHRAQIKRLIADNQASWLTLVPFYDFATSLQANWNVSKPDIIRVTNDLREPQIHLESHRYGSFSRGKLHRLSAGEITVHTSMLAGNEGILGVAAISADSQISTLRSQLIQVDSQIAEKMGYLTGLIQCIDTRFNMQRVCNYQHPNDVDFVDLSQLSLAISAPLKSCESHFPTSAATAYFLCDQLPLDWHGVLSVNTDKLSQIADIYWLTPDMQRTEGLQLSIPNLTLTEQQYQLVVIVR